MADSVLLFEAYLEERFGNKIKRNADKVQESLKEITFGEKIKLTTKARAYLYIPYRFVTAGLAYIEDRIQVISQYALVVGDSYTVANVPALVEIKPDSRKRVKIGDEEYLEFFFDQNAVVLEDTRLFQQSSQVYNIFNEEIAKGNVPLYFSDVDLLFCLDLADSFANLKLGKNNVSLEMIISSITRSSNDPTQYHRLNPDGGYQFIALRNNQLGATNTLAKMMGSYYEPGITSSLSRSSDKLEDIERLMRI
jgi:hypothetical protein